MKVRLPKLNCQQCGHSWVPRKDDVRICPNCKSAYWDEKKEEVNQVIS